MVFEPETMAVWAVSLLVLASVLWLALHGWRQGRALRRWAHDRGLAVEDGSRGPTDAWLEPFRRDDDQMVREVGSVRETVEIAAGIRLFRCEERVDLTPWVSGTGPARTRIVATFPAPEEWETYSVFDESGREASEPPPGLRFADPSVARRIEEQLQDPPHPVSVSVAGGRGMIYLFTPSGGVSPDELDDLARLACRLAQLAESGPAPVPEEDTDGRGARPARPGTGRHGGREPGETAEQVSAAG